MRYGNTNLEVQLLIDKKTIQKDAPSNNANAVTNVSELAFNKTGAILCKILMELMGEFFKTLLFLVVYQSLYLNGWGIFAFF